MRATSCNGMWQLGQRSSRGVSDDGSVGRPATTGAAFFKTRSESCPWNVRAELGPFCRKGLRSPAATCDQMRCHFKLMSPEITAPRFVLPCCIPLTLRHTAVTKNPARQAWTCRNRKCRDPKIDEVRFATYKKTRQTHFEFAALQSIRVFRHWVRVGFAILS